ncbi:MAG: hypothetical protein AAGB46_04180 [Verrucomicrobiota bacterium]
MEADNGLLNRAYLSFGEENRVLEDWGPRLWLGRRIGDGWRVGFGYGELGVAEREGAFPNSCFPPPQPGDEVVCLQVIVPFRFEERFEMVDLFIEQTVLELGRSEFGIGAEVGHLNRKLSSFRWGEGYGEARSDAELNSYMTRRIGEWDLCGRAWFAFRLSEVASLRVSYRYARMSYAKRSHVGIWVTVGF